MFPPWITLGFISGEQVETLFIIEEVIANYKQRERKSNMWD
jgi:hypothetical protein